MPHILLIYLAVGVQRGLDGPLGYRDGRVDFALIAAMYVAACLPRTTGPITAVLAGLALDLSGAAPVGLYAVCFGLGGLLAARLPASRPLPMAVSIVAGVVVAESLRVILFLVRGSFIGDVRPYFWGWPGTILFTGLAALVLSPLLFKVRRLFVVQDRRY